MIITAWMLSVYTTASIPPRYVYNTTINPAIIAQIRGSKSKNSLKIVVSATMFAAVHVIIDGMHITVATVAPRFPNLSRYISDRDAIFNLRRIAQKNIAISTRVRQVAHGSAIVDTTYPVYAVPAAPSSTPPHQFVEKTVPPTMRGPTPLFAIR